MTIGSLFDGTWRFLRANVGSIAIWSLLYLVATVLMRWALIPFYRSQAASAGAAAQGLPPTVPAIGSFVLTMVVMLVFTFVLYNAMFRAVLFPERRGFAYLQLGMDELRLLGLVLILMVLFFVAYLAIIVLFAVGGIALTRLIPTAAAALIGTVAGLAILAVFLFAAVRLVVSAPLTLYRGKIMIGPAWRLSRGKFWTLFGAGLVVWFVLAVLTILLMLPTMGPMIAAMSHPGDPEAQARLAQIQAQQMGLALTPATIVQLLLSAVLGGPVLAVFAGMPAVATLQLLGGRTEELDRVFSGDEGVDGAGPWSR